MSKSLSVALLISIAFVQVATANNEIAPKEWGEKIPWQSGAHVYSRPAMESAMFLTDGDLRTCAKFTRGVEDGAEFTVVFKKPLNITMFRFVQTWLKTNHVRIWARDNANTNMAIVAEWKVDKPKNNEWVNMPINRQVTALRFEAVSGDVGYRAVYPFLCEVEIYSKDRINGGLPRVRGQRLEIAEVLPQPDLTKTKFDFRICTDWWNYGMDQWQKECDKIPLIEWGAFKGALQQLKEVGATSVRMFAESEACAPEGGFTSFPVKGTNPDHLRDWMKPFVEAMHKSGMSVYYFSHAWRAPIQRVGKQAEGVWKRWDWPYMASDALVGINEHYSENYPCLLCEDEFELKWTELLRGALKSNVDGVYVMPDEYYFKGHNLSRADCKACQREFKKMFGYEKMPKLKPAPVANNSSGQVMPPIPEDTEIYRKWKVFEYRKIEELFSRIATNLRKEFPKAKFVFCDNQAAGATGNCYLECSISNDIIGSSNAYDEKQIYGSGSAPADEWSRSIMYAKHFAAAAGEERMLSSSAWGSANLLRPAEKYNAILPDVMLGARRLEVYRLNYMYQNTSVSVYKKLFKMVRLLEKWGIFETKTPEDIGFVYSRASADWWFVKANSMIDPTSERKSTDFNLYLADGDQNINKVNVGTESKTLNRFLAQERVRGFGAQQAVESMLAANGLAYSVLYAERDDNMKNLSRFKTLVVPFAYSLSHEAAKEIASAVDKGTKLVIFGPLGETDEYGTLHQEPVLKNLIGKKGVIHIQGNAGDRSGDLATLLRWAETVAGTIDMPVRVYPNGNVVSSIVREMKDGSGYIVYLCNYKLRQQSEDQRFVDSANVTLSLPVKEGVYRIESYSSDDGEVRAAMIGGYDIPAEKLSRISVSINPQEVKLLRIYKKEFKLKDILSL